MKNTGILILALIPAAVMAFFACASSPQAENPAGNVPVEEIDEVVIDWRGRNAGAERPEWVIAAAQGDPYDELSRLPRVNGRKTILLQQDGANLEIVQAWLNTSAFAECAERIRTVASSRAAGILTGDLQSPEAQNLVDQFRGLYANASITGLERVLDTWVKTRLRSRGTEKYRCYAVYAISEDDLKASIAGTFGKVEARTAQQADLKARIQAQMEDLIASADF
jgi:hypothetical protein